MENFIFCAVKVFEEPDSIFKIEKFAHCPHCVKSVRIRSYSGPYFSALGLNTERSGASLCI